MPKSGGQAFPAILIGIGGAALLLTLTYWWVDRDIRMADRLFETVSRTGRTDDYLNAKLGLLNRRAADIRGSLGYLLAIAGFVTAAQGLFAWFNVQSYQKQADSAVEKLEKIQAGAEDERREAQQRLREIQSRTPAFARMNRVIEDAVGKLKKLFDDPDGFVELYDKVKALEQQQIMYYEKSVAGMESADLPEFRADLSRIYRGLCIFYASRYFSLRRSGLTKPFKRDTAEGGDLWSLQTSPEYAERIRQAAVCYA